MSGRPRWRPARSASPPGSARRPSALSGSRLAPWSDRCALVACPPSPSALAGAQPTPPEHAPFPRCGRLAGGSALPPRGLVAAILGLVLVAGAEPVAGQTFRTGVDAVAVDVLVTRGRDAVAGLTADDFTVLDNGVRQDVAAVLVEEVPVTLLLVLDTSGSVRGAPLRQLLAAAEAAGEALRPDDRVGLVTFSDKLRLAVEPPAPPAELPAALDRMRAGGATALYDATFAALALRDRTVGRTVVLVFSDGYDTTSWLDPLDVLDAARRSDVVVYGVRHDHLAREGWQPREGRGLASRWFADDPHLFRQEYLAHLAAATGGSVYVAADLERLREAFSRVVDEFRSRYLLTYTPQGVEAGGWHELEVRVRGRGRRVQARPGYLR